MLDILKKILQSFDDGKWVLEEIPALYESITSLSEEAKPAPREEWDDVLAHVQKILSLINEGAIRENEVYWCSFIRVIEIYLSRIWRVAIEVKEEVLRVNDKFFLVATDLQRIYSYFTKNDIAIERSVEYDGFRGQVNHKMQVPKFSPTRESDIKTAITQEFILPFHVKRENKRLMNDGFLPLAIESTVLSQGKSVPYDGSTPIAIPYLDIFITTTFFDNAHEASFEGVSRVIREWQPSQKRKFEEGYKAELAQYLRQYFDDVKEERGESDADILVCNKVPIAMKQNPDKTKLDILSGQLGRHKREYGFVISVVCKIQNGSLYEHWKKQYDRDVKIALIEK